MKDKLRMVLDQQYGIKAAAITPAKRGFYGETWRAEAGASAYFIKLDCWPSHKEQYRRSLSVARWLTRQRLDFVAGPVETVTGELSCMLEDGVLAVFPFVEGENREDYPLEQLFERLKRVYALDTSELCLPADAFDDNAAKQLAGLLARMDLELPECAQAVKAIFRENQLQIMHCARRLEEFMAVCVRQPVQLCLTHGDAGGNCILDGEDFTIIDWDEVRLAPIERDTWFFMQDGPFAPWEQIRLLNRVLAPYTLDSDRMCYYCYRMFFTYIGEYLTAILKPSLAEQSREALIHMLKKYFDSWVMAPLGAADTITPGEKR